MLRAVRHAVFAQQRASPAQFFRERRVDRRIPQRCAPRAVRKNRGRLAPWIVPYAKNNDPRRQRHPRKNRSRYVAGINVSRVWDEASFYLNRLMLGIRLRILANKDSEFFRIGGIKASSNGRQAKHVALRKIKWASR